MKINLVCKCASIYKIHLAKVPPLPIIKFDLMCHPSLLFGAIEYLLRACVVLLILMSLSLELARVRESGKFKLIIPRPEWFRDVCSKVCHIRTGTHISNSLLFLFLEEGFILLQ